MHMIKYPEVMFQH